MEPFKPEKKSAGGKDAKVIGVASGKGGVGKSSVAALLAQALAASGARVGLLDADITGPSAPRLMGVESFRAGAEDHKLVPVVAEGGVKVMSINFLMEEESTPVIWRGPLLSRAVKQFMDDTAWDELDWLVVDLPPGTGDVMLTALQSFRFDGLVFVATPQDFVSMIVAKTVHMAAQTGTRSLGVVVNMGSMVCPKCGEEFPLFSDDGAERLGLPVLARLPWLAPIAQGRNLLRSGLPERVVKASDALASAVKGVLAAVEAGPGTGLDVPAREAERSAGAAPEGSAAD